MRDNPPFSRRNAFSWALYDFANTIYSAIVITVYLPLYLTSATGKNTSLGIAATLSMVATGLLVPYFGALSDRTGRTKQYLLMATGGCILATSSLSFTNTPLKLLIFFGCANVLFHASLVFYNSLLPVVSPPGKRGFISGLGVGLGYFGVFFSLPIAHLVDTHLGQQWVFLTAGILFLLFAIPLFLHVPERPATSQELFKPLKSLRAVCSNRGALFFLLGNFFLLDALNAGILWLSVFLRNNYDVSQSTLIQIVMGLNFSAFLSGIVIGKFSDRYGSKITFLISMVCLTVVFLSLGFLTSLKSTAIMVILFGGIAPAGIWTAGRKWLVELAPKDQVGEYFGLYGLTTKVSAIGSTTVALLADSFGFRLAALSQLAPILIAFIFILRTPSGSSASSSNSFKG